MSKIAMNPFENDSFIEITGTDLIELIKLVYSLSEPVGLGFIHFTEGELTTDEAEQFISNDSGFLVHMDYVKGRCCKFIIHKYQDRLFIPSLWPDHTELQLMELLSRIGIVTDLPI